MAVNGGGEKNILALTLGRRASGRRGAVDGTLRAGGRCGCGGGDRREGRRINGGGDHWSSPVRAMEGGNTAWRAAGPALARRAREAAGQARPKERGALVLEDQGGRGHAWWGGRGLVFDRRKKNGGKKREKEKGEKGKENEKGK
jgi:hypothetical protein